MSSRIKQCIAGYLIISVLMTALSGVIGTKEVNAFGFGGGGGSGAANTVPVSDMLNAPNHFYQQLKESGLDGIAVSMAKQLLHQMTMDVVNWINNGFEGSPAFLTNPENFLIDAADQVTGAFLANNGPLSLLCSPYSFDIRVNIALNKAGGGINRRYSCTLSKIIQNTKKAGVTVNGASIDGFLGGDFHQGGWPAFMALTTVEQNNIYGAYLRSSADIDAKIDARKADINIDLTRGNGFMSWQKCSDVSAGQVYYDQNLQENVVADTEYGAVDSADDYAAYTSQFQGQSTTGSAVQTRTAPAPALKKPQTCTTETPGSVISGSLQKSLGIPADQLNMADEINEVVNALIGQLVTQVLHKGLASASGGGSGDKSSVVTQILDENNRGTAGYNQLQGSLSSIRSNLQSNLNPYTNNIRTIQSIYSDLLNTATETKNLFNAVIACYQNRLTSTSTITSTNTNYFGNNRFNPEQERNQINNLNNTITTKIDPIISNLRSGLDVASSSLITINSLRGDLDNANTTQQLTVMGDRMSGMVRQHAFPEQVDVLAVQNEATNIRNELIRLDGEARAAGRYCGNF